MVSTKMTSPNCDSGPNSSCISTPIPKKKSPTGVILRSFYLLQSISFYIFAINSKKCPPLTRILLVNICLIFSTLFFVMTWIAFAVLTMATSIFVQMLFLQYLSNDSVNV